MKKKHSKISRKDPKLGKKIKKIKRRFFTIELLVIILLLLIGIYAIVNRDNLQSVIKETIGVYGYIAVFIISLIIETIPQPFAIELVLLFGIGFGLNTYICFLLIMLSITIGDFINYAIGHTYGKTWIINMYGLKKYNKWNKIYQKYGRYSLTISGVGPFLPYKPFCWLSGIFMLKKRFFFLYGIVPKWVRMSILLFFMNYLINI